ncbi:MAG TPA: hypothetical protein ENM97_00095 [Moorella mulderi]|nr:hypothetical protein [Moorella mulderi]
MGAVLVILAFLFIAYLDAPELWQKRRWKELVIAEGVWSLALGLSLAQVFHLRLPDAFQILTRIFAPLTRWLYHLLVGT